MRNHARTAPDPATAGAARLRPRPCIADAGRLENPMASDLETASRSTTVTGEEPRALAASTMRRPAARASRVPGDGAARGRRARRALIYCGDLANVGDLAITLSTIAALRREDAAEEILVSQWRAVPSDVVRQIEDAGAGIVPSKALGRALAMSVGALHVIGGGQLVRENQSRAALGLLFARTGIGRLTGGRVVAVGLGVSPMGHGAAAWLWRRILKGCEAIAVRDAGSRAHVAALTGRDPVVAADMVFLGENWSERRAVGAPRRRIVIAPCIDSSEGRRIPADHLRTLIDCARRRWPDSQITFALHDAGERQDAAAAREIADALDLGPHALVDTLDLDAFLGVYAEASVVFTNRLHALLFAVRSASPVVALNDGGKIAAAAADLDLAAADADRAYRPAELEGLLERALARALDGEATEKVRGRARRNLDVILGQASRATRLASE